MNDPRAKKYCQWNDTSGYYTRSQVILDPYKTEKSLTLQTSTENLNLSVRINNEQRERNRSQVVRKDKLALPPLNGTTVYEKHFINQKSWKNELLSVNEERWSACFDEYAVTLSENQQDETGLRSSYRIEGRFILQNDLFKIVKSCLGENVPSFIIDKILTLGQIYSKERRIFYEDFM